MVRTRLVVEVEDHTWQRQLFALTPQFCATWKSTWAAAWWTTWNSAWCRGGASRSAPSQAVPRAAAADEADAIADPVLRGIYKASRKKALA